MEESSMDQGAKSAHHLLTANEREYLSKLCWLLYDAGTHALRVTFDNIHPPVLLTEHLAKIPVKTVLSRLQQQKLLTENEWKILYPHLKKGASSQKYDSKLLATLLQTICHLSPPYPHGWNAMPLPADISLSADVARMSILFQQVGSLGGVRDDEYPVLWKQIGEVLLRLGGPAAKIKIQRIDNESVPVDQQSYYIQLIKDIWGTEDGKFKGSIEDILRQSQSTKSVKLKSSRSKKKDDERIPPEDLHVLQKVHKRLTDNVIAVDIIDRLQQGQIIKISDRQEIMALNKNQERMTKILEKIRDSKISYAFKLLCDALKFKFPKEYDAVMKIRKETFKMGLTETVDLVGICKQELSFQYKYAFSRCIPLPWLETLHMCVRDYYTTPDLVDTEGNTLHLKQLLPDHSTCGSGKGRHVVIEGAPGSGQTTLAMMIAHTWANIENYFDVKYDFLVYIDAQALGENNMRQALYLSVLPENSKLSAKDFWSLLEANAKNVVFLVDGFDETVTCQELTSIMQGGCFRASALLVLVNPGQHISRYVTADRKIFNLGLNAGGIVRCLTTYAQMIGMTEDDSQSLIDTVENSEWDFTNDLGSPFLCLALVIVLKTCKVKSVTDISSVTELLELFAEAMVKCFCARQNIEPQGGKYPAEVHKALAQIERFVYQAKITGSGSFTDEQVIQASNNILITKFAVFVKSGLTGYWSMTCSLLSDFLIANYLASMDMYGLAELLIEQHFLTRSRHANMVSYLCAVYKDDSDAPAPEGVFLKLKENNINMTQRFTVKNTKLVEEYDAPSDTGHMTTGHVVDYMSSLQGLTECKCREDIVLLIVESMPNHLIVRRDGMLPYECVRGLGAVLRHDAVNITHIEINLLPVFMHQQKTYFKLAEAMASSPKLKGLRVLWYGLDLMAQFLVLATNGAKPLRSIQLEDCCKNYPEHVSAATWSNLQDFCTNLETVKKFVFLNCKMASVVCHVLHHLPHTLEELDFAGCAMNPISGGEISTKIEHSKSLREINLNNTRLESSDVKALTQGMKLGESLRVLKIGGTRLDTSGMMALAESIRLSSSLHCLDLSNSELTTELCRILTGAIQQCRTLVKLVLSHTRISSEGRMVLSQAKYLKLELVGLATSKPLLLFS